MLMFSQVNPKYAIGFSALTTSDELNDMIGIKAMEWHFAKNVSERENLYCCLIIRKRNESINVYSIIILKFHLKNKYSYIVLLIHSYKNEKRYTNTFL